MGSVYAGVGLVSGIDHQSIISRLMAIERRPLDSVNSRISILDTQKTAFLDVAARLTAMRSRLSTLALAQTFRSAKATSSNASVLAATTTSGASPGTYQFVVRGLASTHHLVSRGYGSASASLGSGTLTIESAQARVNRATSLNELNAQAGVQRGSFRITNRAGASATVNLADALTVDDVIARINSAGISVTATVGGDGLVLTDSSTGTGTLRIEDLAGGQSAADLGFAGALGIDADGDGQLVGAALMRATATTALRTLNDGVGLRRSRAGGDFTIRSGAGDVTVDLSDVLKPDTRLERLNHAQGVRLGTVRISTRDGTTATVDLTAARTVGDVETALEAAFGGGRISVTLTGSRLIVMDSTAAPDGQAEQALKIEDVTGHAAADLGLAGPGRPGQLDGTAILQVETLADVLAAINYATGNLAPDGSRNITAALAADGQRITLASSGGEMELVAGTSRALEDLGLSAGAYDASAIGRRIVGGLNTVLVRSLRGGQGVSDGVVRLTTGSGSVDIDLAGVETLAQLMERVRTSAQQAGLGVQVGVDGTGTRLVLTASSGQIELADLQGDVAASLGLSGSGTSLRSDNLQRQYVSENTLLSSLSNGRGVALGTLRITATSGASTTLDLTALQPTTLQDVINAINDTNIGVQARINDTGDGLLVVDSNGGTQALRIEDVNGTAARDLNIRQTSTTGQIDGSFEFRLVVGGSDTLATLAARLASDTTLADARLLNDGSGASAYRLSILSRVSGSAGELVVDDGGLGLGLATLTQAQDARLLFGGSADSGLLLTSTTNTFADVVPGLTLTAASVSDQPVTVTVQSDNAAAASALEGLLTGVTDLLSRIREMSSYDSETKRRGVLLGDAALRAVENRVFRMLSQTFVVPGTGLRRLADVGVKLSNGREFSLDKDAFARALEADPEGVIKLFTAAETGVAAVLQREIKILTEDSGIIPSRTSTLDDQRTLLTSRVTSMQKVLDAKEARLRRQFQVMEQTLASLQSQQTTLSNLATLASSFSSSRSSSSG